MDNFDLSMKYRILYTNDCVASVLLLLKDLKSKRIMIIVDSALKLHERITKLIRTLEEKGLPVSIFTEIEPNPTTDNVEMGLTQAKKFKPDVFLAFGGGSALDCAKAINILFCRRGVSKDLVGILKNPTPLLPLLALPTTAGTGSEVSPFLLVTNSHSRSKIVIRDPQAVPYAAVLDPNLSVSLPFEPTLYSGLDALVHAFESYVALGTQTFTQALSLRAIELIIDNLPLVINNPNNVDARGNMLLAANMAGIAFSLSYLGLAHSIANALSKIYNLPHGLAVGLMLAPVIRYNSPVAAQQYTQIAHSLLKNKCPKNDRDAAHALADFIYSFEVSQGMPRSLGEVGISKEDIPHLIRESLRQATVKSNPRYPTPSDLEALLSECI